MSRYPGAIDCSPPSTALPAPTARSDDMAAAATGIEMPNRCRPQPLAEAEGRRLTLISGLVKTPADEYIIKKPPNALGTAGLHTFSSTARARVQSERAVVHSARAVGAKSGDRKLGVVLPVAAWQPHQMFGYLR